MFSFIIYDLKVAALIAVFYMFYRLLLCKKNFHRLNRIVLLATALLSFILPLCVITLHKTVVVEDALMTVSVSAAADAVTMPAVKAANFWQTHTFRVMVTVIFIAGIVFRLLTVCRAVFRLNRHIGKMDKYALADGIVIAVSPHRVAPFSWFKTIVMSREDHEQNSRAVLLHERAHIELRHSWDVMLVEVVTAFQWFNPAVWMLRADLRGVHEYEADKAVLNNGVDIRNYVDVLIEKARASGGYSLANGIMNSTLKNRIIMMCYKNKKNDRAWLRALYVLPVAAVALALNATTSVKYVNATQPQTSIDATPAHVVNVPSSIPVQQPVERATAKMVQEPTVATEDAASAEPVAPNAFEEQSSVYQVTDKMPEFPGGVSEMMKYISSNIRYPKEFANVNLKSRVIVAFVVKADGTIDNVKINNTKIQPLTDSATDINEKAAAKAFETEAMRVVKSMPNWTPGEQDGKRVSVAYTLPLQFHSGK